MGLVEWVRREAYLLTRKEMKLWSAGYALGALLALLGEMFLALGTILLVTGFFAIRWTFDLYSSLSDMESRRTDGVDEGDGLPPD